MRTTLRSLVLYSFASACVVLAACSSDGGDSAPATTPTSSQGPASETIQAAPVALPTEGTFVQFPTASGATGEFKMPYSTAAAGTTIALSTTFGSGSVPAAHLRKRASSGSMPVSLMSLGVNVSANVKLSTLPVTVFTIPAALAPAGRVTLEVFDDSTGTLVLAEPQGEPAEGVIGFSENVADGTAQDVAIDLQAGRNYSLALVENSGLTLPEPGTPCGYPPPLPILPVDLAYPEPSATGVPISAGELLLQGYAGEDYFGPRTLSMTAGSSAILSGVSIATSPAPSPFPSPYATPLGSGGPFEAVPIPTLSAQTQYTVTSTYFDFSDVPPACTAPYSETLGTFTTL